MKRLRIVPLAFAAMVALSGTAHAQKDRNDAMFQACQPAVTKAVQRQLGAKQRVQLFYGDWTVEFVSNAEERMRGGGQYETNNGFRQFTFQCLWNIRNGSVTDVRVAEKKPGPQPGKPGKPQNPQGDRAAYEACKPGANRAVQRELGATSPVRFNDKAWNVEFVNMAEVRVRGRGEYTARRGPSNFSFVCLYNVRDGRTSDIRVVRR
ncbi:hypothetical protein L1787_01225 [Acuticoccus sp. M5D2P5]|uniref:hypothetical protein n=1 Tax=Acuticoccus kalidii TaxID=2910977 RepID=UPI001F2E79C1|nr:hypothetical protein [Acuticoccus kalidii]MCF3932034.1 hypothetical protein [Acuticoccus kalidii]